MPPRIHPSSVVSEHAHVGDRAQIWLFCQVRDHARIGEDSILGKGVYVDTDVHIGARCKVQNNVSIFTGVTLEDGVFIGPHVCFTNDKVPRAVNPDGTLKGADDWHVTPTRVRTGAAVGANATIVCGVTVGRWAMVGSGAVVTKDVPDHGLVLGNPARLVGYVCSCGQRVTFEGDTASCPCGRKLRREGGVVREE